MIRFVLFEALKVGFTVAAFYAIIRLIPIIHGAF